MRIARRRPRRAITTTLATILLLAITLVGGALLWLFRPGLPSEPTEIDYQVLTGEVAPQWGDGSDCHTVNGAESCLTLPAIDIVITGFSPNYIPLNALHFYFFCNGSIYLSSVFADMRIVPGSTQAISGNAPQLQTCGTYVPPHAAFNRLAYFEQIQPGDVFLVQGDELIVTAHSFMPPNCPNAGGNPCDDDFHGAPAWCYTVVDACSIVVYWSPTSGDLSSTLLRIPLFGLSA